MQVSTQKPRRETLLDLKTLWSPGPQATQARKLKGKQKPKEKKLKNLQPNLYLLQIQMMRSQNKSTVKNN